MKEMIISCLAFGFFVVCPRMAGMLPILAKNSQSSMFSIVMIGTVVSLPILGLMVYMFLKFGLLAALGLCIITDICAAAIMSNLSIKSGIDTFVIAIFVIVGVKIAPVISSLLEKMITK